MNDIFLEQLVNRKKSTSDKIKIGLLIFAGVIVTIVLFMALWIFKLATFESNPALGEFIMPVGLLLIAGVWYGIYLLMGNFNIEYEYVLVNEELDIDKILAKKGRKHLMSLNIKEATLMARIDDNEHNSVYKNPPAGVKVYNYSGMSDSGFTYFIDGSVDDERVIVLFQPMQKIVDALWKYNPRAVKQYKG